MSRVAAAAGLLSSTLVFTAALLWVNPFDAMSGLMDTAFGAAPAWTQISNADTDPLIHDASHGERPTASFEKLAAVLEEPAGETKSGNRSATRRCLR